MGWFWKFLGGAGYGKVAAVRPNRTTNLKREAPASPGPFLPGVRAIAGACRHRMTINAPPDRVIGCRCRAPSSHTKNAGSGHPARLSSRKPAECLAPPSRSVHQPRRDESNYRRVESSTCHLPSCIAAPTWHYRWWVNHGGTPINCIRLQVADFRRPSHMDTGKPFLRAKKCPRGRV